MHAGDHTTDPNVPQRRGRGWVVILVLCLGFGATAWWLGPDLLARARAELTLRAYLRAGEDERDIYELEEALLPLGEQAALALAAAVERTGELDLLHAFEYMPPGDSLPVMRRLLGSPDPDLRHGAMLALTRLRQVPLEQLEDVVEDPDEDRFIRLMAAMQLGLPPDWWQEVPAGPDPRTLEGEMGRRRVTYERESVTLQRLAEELAWVTGGVLSSTPAAAEVELEQVYYLHVELAGMISDLRLRTGPLRLRLASGGDLVIEEAPPD
jgi:hypothetical protein